MYELEDQHGNVGGFQDNLSKQLKRWPKLSSTPTSALFKN
jgi:hypothetical protein